MNTVSIQRTRPAFSGARSTPANPGQYQSLSNPATTLSTVPAPLAFGSLGDRWKTVKNWVSDKVDARLEAYSKRRQTIQEAQTAAKALREADWRETARSGGSLKKLAVLTEMRALPIDSEAEAQTWADVLVEMAGNSGPEVQQKILEEFRSEGWGDYEAQQMQGMDALARHGTAGIRISVLREIGDWNNASQEQANVLLTLIQNGDRPLHWQVLKEVQKEKWYDDFPLVGQVLKALAKQGDPALNDAIDVELGEWDESDRTLIHEIRQIIYGARAS